MNGERASTDLKGVMMWTERSEWRQMDRFAKALRDSVAFKGAIADGFDVVSKAD
jgi:hypothetical protein